MRARRMTKTKDRKVAVASAARTKKINRGAGVQFGQTRF